MGKAQRLLSRKKRKDEREIEAAMQCGVDMLAYGVTLNNGAEDSTNVMTTDDGCQPPTKKRRGTKDTLKYRFESASNSEMKIREVKSTLKKTITVVNSSKGKNNYVVQITSIPSCTCSVYHKNKSKVLCKHIIFVVTVALGGMDLVETLRTRYIGDDALKALLRKQIPAKYLQKNEKKTKKS